jgi:hypothetical protein
MAFEAVMSPGLRMCARDETGVKSPGPDAGHRDACHAPGSRDAGRVMRANAAVTIGHTLL